MQDPRFYSLLLHRIPQVGAATFERLLAQFGSPQDALRAPLNRLAPLLDKVSLQSINEFQHHAEKSTLGQKVLVDLEWLSQQSDVHLLAIGDEVYPHLLAQIPKPPPLLFVRGDVQSLDLPQIAIVGSRTPSAGGGENAYRFAEFLGANGFVITSGLALGVDASAHMGAMNSKGKTVAVMGTGLDIVYPSHHRRMAQAIVGSGGALVSELPLGSGPKAANFPQRNRIISGLSCGVLVVEAALQSGSLITARTAMQQNREVFAIPGSIHNPLARGCHHLIRQGATLVETAQDIVDQLQGLLGYERERLDKVQKKSIKCIDNAKNEVENLTSGEATVIQAMGFDPVSVDELFERTQMEFGQLMAQLVGLEIKGVIQQFGSTYQRV